MNYLKYLVEEIHTTVMATVDNNGLPVTCAIDIMDYDDTGLYFLTAKGKKLYERLKQKGYTEISDGSFSKFSMPALENSSNISSYNSFIILRFSARC